MKNRLAVSLLLSCATPRASAKPWVPGLGDGRYKNPVLFADYSDPDPVKVGADFYTSAAAMPISTGSESTDY